jgi:hypothetical protein
MVTFHSGYQLKDKDFRDVSALCKKFEIDLPPVYERFKRRARGRDLTSGCAVAGESWREQSINTF